MNFSVLILAAGSSSRFGSPKQLAGYRGKPVLNWAIEAALDSGAEQVVLVTNPELALDVPLGVLTVINPTFKDGIGSSISMGIAHIDRDICVISLGDQPNVQPEHLKALAQAIGGGATIAASDYQDGSCGVPAAFHQVHFPELSALQGDQGAKGMIRKRRDECVTLPLSLEAQLDIDYPSDL